MPYRHDFSPRKNMHFIMGSLLLMTMIFTMALPWLTVNAESTEDSAPTTVMEPITLDIAYDLFFFPRIELLTVQNITKDGARTPHSPVAFYLGNGVCIDINKNIYVDAFKLLKLDLTRNFELNIMEADKTPGIFLVKSGPDIVFKTASGIQEKNSATFTGTEFTRTTNLLVQTITFTGNGLEYNTNMALAFGGKRTMTKDGKKVVYKQSMLKITAEKTRDNLVTLPGMYIIEQSGNSYLVNVKFGGVFGAKKFRIEFGENKVAFYKGDELVNLVIVEENKVTTSRDDRKITFELKYTE